MGGCGPKMVRSKMVRSKANAPYALKGRYANGRMGPYAPTGPQVGGRNLMRQAGPDHPENSIGAGDSFARKKIETNQILSMDLLRFREKPIKSRHYMKEPTARHKKR